MKKLLIPVLALLIVIALPGCGSHNDPGNTNVTINANSDLSKGLDLVALGEMLKKSKDAKTLEEELNKDGSINNVDLDGDGKVDYLKVTEYGEGSERGLSITDEVKKGEVQEIATVQITKTNDHEAEVNVQGNQDIYGPQANYHSTFTDFLILSYLFTPHPYYYSPWGFGYYPGWYRPMVVVPYGAYHSRVQTVTRSSTMTRSSGPYSSHIKSPNAGKSSSTALSRSVNSPSHSAKSFNARESGKSVGKGGFGKGSGSHMSPSHSGGGFGSGSHRSFGGGRGGFGRRR
jgi:hypothetical protein